MMLLVLAAVLVALFVWRTAWSSHVERSVDARLRVGPNGMVPGTEPVDLQPSSPVGAVLLLHGFGDSPQSLTHLTRALYESGFSVYAPLLPGHGRTLRDFRSSTEAEWLAEARRALEVVRARADRVGVVGMSMGGALATILASESNDVAALVLLAPYLDPPPSVRAMAAMAPLAQWLVPYLRGGDPRSIYDPAAHAAALSYRAVAPRAIAQLVKLTSLARARLSRVSAPTLYIQSREDYRVSVAAAERSFGLLGAKEKQLEWLAGCGHVITADYCKERVAELVTGWLEAKLERDDVRSRVLPGRSSLR